MLNGYYLMRGRHEMNLEPSPHGMFWALLPSWYLPEEPLCSELMEEGFGMCSLKQLPTPPSICVFVQGREQQNGP